MTAENGVMYRCDGPNCDGRWLVYRPMPIITKTVCLPAAAFQQYRQLHNEKRRWKPRAE